MLNFESRKYDYRIDLWALGCIAYEIFSGSRLFSGSSVSTIRSNILNFNKELCLKNLKSVD